MTVALASKHSAEWKQAMSVELDNLEKQNAWEIVKKPCGYRTIGSKWVFAIKGIIKETLSDSKLGLSLRGMGKFWG